MAEGGSNVVTWGVFPGQEIAASTIIERDSFLAWKVRKIVLLPSILDAPRLRTRRLDSGRNGHFSTHQIRLNEQTWRNSETNDGSSVSSIMTIRAWRHYGRSCFRIEFAIP